MVVSKEPHKINEYPELELLGIRVSLGGSTLKIPNKKTPSRDSFYNGDKATRVFM